VGFILCCLVWSEGEVFLGDYGWGDWFLLNIFVYVQYGFWHFHWRIISCGNTQVYYFYPFLRHLRRAHKYFVQVGENIRQTDFAFRFHGGILGWAGVLFQKVILWCYYFWIFTTRECLILRHLRARFRRTVLMPDKRFDRAVTLPLILASRGLLTAIIDHACFRYIWWAQERFLFYLSSRGDKPLIVFDRRFGTEHAQQLLMIMCHVHRRVALLRFLWRWRTGRKLDHMFFIL